MDHAAISQSKVYATMYAAAKAATVAAAAPAAAAPAAEGRTSLKEVLLNGVSDDVLSTMVF